MTALLLTLVGILAILLGAFLIHPGAALVALGVGFFRLATATSSVRSPK